MDSVLRSAVIVAQLPAGLAAAITSELPSAALTQLAAALPQVLELSREARLLTVRAFMLELAVRIGSKVPNLDAGGLARLCRSEPAEAALLLRAWLRPPVKKINLPRRQTAAILLMSLPPDVSAQLFKELGPEEVQALTLEISKLPMILPEVRQAVVSEFCETVGLGSLEEDSRQRPGAVAQGLCQWLEKEASPAEAVAPRSAPARRRRKLEEPAPPEPPSDNSLQLELPESFLATKASRALQQYVAELGATWRCNFPSLELVPRPGSQVRLRFGQRTLLETEVHPELFLASSPRSGEQVWILRHELDHSRKSGWKIESALKVLRHRLGMALADLVCDLWGQGPGLSLSEEAVITAAVLRNFHPNELLPELNSLTPEDLARVARGYLHCLSLPEEDWEKVLIESAQVSPRELLELAGLVAPAQQRRRVRHCAALLRQLEDPQPVWQGLWELLTLKEAVQVAERMHRLLISPQRTTTAQETFEALAEFAEWRTRSSHHPGSSAPLNAKALLGAIPRVWPRLKLQPLRQALLRIPAPSLARQLVSYLRESAPVNYLPGPLRAAHLVNSLADSDALRAELGARGYPIPRLPADLEWQARAREEWARRARPLGRN